MAKEITEREMVECENCSNGIIVWDKEVEEFICNKCGALYK